MLTTRLTGLIALRVAVGVSLFVCAMSASATSAYYLEVPGVTGPVDAPGLSGAFNVDAFSFGTSLLTESMDVLTPSAEAAPLIRAATSGKYFSLVYLDGFTYTSSATDYFKYTLKDALIASISSGSGRGVPEDRSFSTSRRSP